MISPIAHHTPALFGHQTKLSVTTGQSGEPTHIADSLKFSGKKKKLRGGVLGVVGYIIASLASSAALLTGAGTLAHYGATELNGGKESNVVAQMQDAETTLDTLNPQSIPGHDPVPYFNEMNEALAGYNGNALESVPAFNQLSLAGQAKTRQLLSELQSEKNWQDNWSAHARSFNNWVDDVLVAEGRVSKTDADMVKDEAREVLRSASTYEDFHQLGVTLLKASLLAFGGGLAMFVLGTGLAVSDSAKKHHLPEPAKGSRPEPKA